MLDLGEKIITKHYTRLRSKAQGLTGICFTNLITVKEHGHLRVNFVL